MKRFTKILDTCEIRFRKPSALTYHCKIICNNGGIHQWDIIGCGNSLEQAINDAWFVYENRHDKIKMHGIEWKFKSIEPSKQ